MGCDIHLVIEYRPVVGHSRPDADVRALLRAIDADPTPSLAARLRSWEIRSNAWEPACFDYYAGYKSEKEEDEEGHARLAVGVRRALLRDHPERDRVEPQRTYMRIYSVLPSPAHCRDRDYEAFRTLTGTVRNYQDGEPGRHLTDTPRGMPEDASAYSAALAEGWDGDGHSHSWLTVAEILPRVDLLPPPYADMVRWWAEAMPPEHVRLVFFFDN